MKGRDARANVVGQYRPDGFFFHGEFARLKAGAKCRTTFTGWNILDLPNAETGRSDEVVCP